MKAKTPLLQYYFELKEQHPEVLMTIRVGDFFEFYGEDAETASKVLEITLSGKEDGSNGRIPMAGVPHHAFERYAARLLSLGYKVAICDQVEDPKYAKGLVKRAITRILTPGTLMEDSMLSAKQNNFLSALIIQGDEIGLSSLDPSTGDFWVTCLKGSWDTPELLHELARLKPSELLSPSDQLAPEEALQKQLGFVMSSVPSLSYSRAYPALLNHFKVQNLKGFGCQEQPSVVISAAMILEYIKKNCLPAEHIDRLSPYNVHDFMGLDLSTRKSLELTQNLSNGGREYTLLSVLDQCQTTMGSRLVRRWIEQPVLDQNTLIKRHDSVDAWVQNSFARQDLCNNLKNVQDIERLVSRICASLANPRDLAALKRSLLALEPIKKLLHLEVKHIEQLANQIGDYTEVCQLLQESIVEDPPLTLKDGGIICSGYDMELDKLRELGKNGKEYIAQLEAKEREKIGVQTLKVGYNSVFGYYLEIGKNHIQKVPDHYVRKQTTANSERYITAELKEQEAAVLGAEGKSILLESEIFQKIRRRLSEKAQELLKTAKAIAEVDVLSNLAHIATQNKYVRPEIVDENKLVIKNGRHPIVERYFPQFIPNQTHFSSSTRIKLLTGPNMSGKSTYLRQNALIVLMAQIGSFVPAEVCILSICDRVFARIGAKDEIALGQSTFMVEMVESANILNNATEKSLVILDEVGRGTSTYDGLAIAWAMVEHLSRIRCKALFATHYHQLNQLEDEIETLKNYRVSVEEEEDKVIWTHRVLPGGTNQSYGIHVARMAGIPKVVLTRATSILNQLEEKKQVKITKAQAVIHQEVLFKEETNPLVEKLKKLEVNNLTPIQALNLLQEWKNKL